MRKFYLVLLLSVFVSFTLSAQNVGIGTDMPDTKLEISGDQGTDLLRVEDHNENTRFYIENEGNVGIGTASPQARLHVLAPGGGSIAQFHAYNNANPSIVLESENNAPGMGVIRLLWAGSAQDRVVFTANSGSYWHPDAGNVGIGLTNPQYRLDVDGTGRFTDQVSIPLVPVEPEHAASKDYVDSQIADNTGDELWQEASNDRIYYDAGNVAIGTDDPLYQFYIVSEEDVAGTDGEFVNMENAPMVVRSHFGSGSGQMTGIGFTVSSVDANVGGAIALERTGLQSEARMHFAVKDNTTQGANDIPIRMTINETGNVGVGTTSPEAKFEVFSEDNDDLLRLSRDSDHWNFRVNNQGRLQIYEENSARVTVRDGGDVGIGTTLPNSRLHINSQSGDDPLRVQIAGATRFFVSSDGGVTIGDFQDSPPSRGLYVFGNTGIGTHTPSEKLDVDGNITLSSGSDGTIFARNLQTHDGSSFYINNNSGNREFRLNSNGVAIYNRLVVGDNDPSIGPSNGLYVNGNTGLGNNNPQGKLHVSLDNSLDQPVIIDKANGTGNGSLMEWYGFSTTHRLQLTYEGSPFRYEFNTDQSSRNISFAPDQSLSLFLDAGNQNVGIKTDNPTADLDIDGEIRIRGGNPAPGRVLTTDANGNASWEDPGSGSSNWTVTGDDIYNSNSGNVGVGTTSPSSTAQFHSVLTTSGTNQQRAGFFRVNWSAGSAQAFALEARADKSSSTTSGRSTGIVARGGNATNRWNTGVSAVLSGSNDGAAIVAGTVDDYTDFGFGSSFQPQYVSPAGQWGIVSYSDVFFHQDHYVMGDIGVGTADPVASLHVKSSNWRDHIIIDRTDNNNIDRIFGITQTTTDGGRAQFYFADPDNSMPYNYVFQIQEDDTNNGRVGINANPTTELDIDGQIRIRGGDPGSGKVLTSDANGLATWEEPSGGGGGGSNWELDGDDLSNLNSGNVGINTISSTGLQSELTVRQTSNPITGSNIILDNLAADFRQTSTSNSQGSGIKFTVGNSNSYTGTAAIVAERTGLWSQGKLHFAVNDAGASGKSDIPILMTLDGPGNEMEVFGDLSATGTKNFKIEHPENPDMWLYHAAVESDEVLNKYSGNITTDENGYARVELPSYVALINKDFRYQLTVIGVFAQAIIKEEFEDDTFLIQTDEPNVKVSWEMTGVRNDRHMQENPFKAERAKAQFSDEIDQEELKQR